MFQNEDIAFKQTTIQDEIDAIKDIISAIDKSLGLSEKKDSGKRKDPKQ
jgi:hypothetical protein